MRPAPIMRRRRPELTDSRPPAPIDSSGALPSGAWAEILGLAAPDTVKVTADNVRGLPALDKARSLVVNSVASMLVEAQCFDALGHLVDKPLVIARPHPLLPAFEFYTQVVDNVVTHGNFVATIGYTEDGEAFLVPVPLGAVSVDASSGLPEYTIGNRRFSWREIFHVRSNAPVGTWWGIGAVERFRRSLSEHLHSQAYGENSFKTGAVPSMVVQLDIPHPTEEQVTATKDGLLEKLGNGRREPLVYGSVLKQVTPIGWSPQDAEFVESRQLSYAECAWIIGLRPEDIGATAAGYSLTYANRVDDNLQRITDGYQPWSEKIEGPLSDLVRLEVRGNPEALMRMSTKERYETRALAQAIGVETKEESRAEEGRPPLPAQPEPKPQSEIEEEAA